MRVGTAWAAVVLAAAAAGALAQSGSFKVPTGPIQLPHGPIKVDPSIFDIQMRFDFRGAYKVANGYSLDFPGPPTATAQGVRRDMMFWSFTWPEPATKRSAAIMIFSAAAKPATADFVSNAFDLSARRAVTLDWRGYFDFPKFPIQVRLSFGADRTIGSVLFDKGQVRVGPPGAEVAIGPYAVDSLGKQKQHRLTIRSDLVAQTYTVEFEQGGTSVTSAPVPFPAATPAVPAGQVQVTARLTSSDTYASGYYYLSEATLRGEKK